MPDKLRFTRYDYAAFLTFGLYACCSMIIPMVLYSLAKDMNFPLDEGGKGLGGTLQMGRAIPMFVIMPLCGYFGAKIGKAHTLGAATLFMCAGIVFCAFSPSYLFLFTALAVAGIGEALIEGLSTPFVQDQHPEEPGRYINFSHAFWSLGIVLLVLSVGKLLDLGVHWRTLVFTTGLLALIPALMFLWPDRKKLLKPADASARNSVIKNSWTIFKVKRFWVFFAAMFFAGGGEFCLTFWVTSYIKLEYIGATLFEAGIGAACFSLGMIGGRMFAGICLKQNQLGKLLLYCSLGATLVSIFFPFIRSLGILFPLLAVIGFFCGPFWPSLQSHASTRMEVDNTTLFILLSCAGIPGCGFFSMLMGVAGDNFGLRNSFFLATGCYALIGLLTLADSLVPRAPLRQMKTTPKSF